MAARTIRGAVAGLIGVAAMAGVITTLRRALLTSEQLAASRTHPEKIVQTIADKTQFVVDNRYPGMMIWELAHDTREAATSLLHTVDQVANP